MDWGDRDWAQNDEWEPRISDDSAALPAATPRTARAAILLGAVTLAAIACVVAGQVPRHHPLVPAFSFTLPHIGGRTSHAVDTSVAGGRTEPLGGCQRRDRSIHLHAARADGVDGRASRARPGRAPRPVESGTVARARPDTDRRRRELSRDDQAAPTRPPRPAAPAARRIRRDENAPRQLNRGGIYRSSRASSITACSCDA